MNVLDGITTLDPMPYGSRRWNGTVWADAHVDTYNKELTKIMSLHNAGYDTVRLVDGLYNLAHGFDVINKELDKLVEDES